MADDRTDNPTSDTTDLAESAPDTAADAASIELADTVASVVAVGEDAVAAPDVTRAPQDAAPQDAAASDDANETVPDPESVSYTHLTLPTILRV